MPRKEAQVGRSCARGSNKCAKGRFLLQRPRKVPPRWGTSVPHRAGTFPHRCSEKVEIDSLQRTHAGVFATAAVKSASAVGHVGAPPRGHFSAPL